MKGESWAGPRRLRKWGLNWLKLILFSVLLLFTHYITYIKCLVAIVCHKNDLEFFALQTNVVQPVWNFWKSPDEIISYDTYIIFEKHLGAMLFAQNKSKNLNIF